MDLRGGFVETKTRDHTPLDLRAIFADYPGSRLGVSDVC
jgi:hypothetical protein